MYIHLYACMLYNLGFRPSTLTVYMRILIVCGLPHFCWPPMHNQNAHINGKCGRPGTKATCCTCICDHTCNVFVLPFLSLPYLLTFLPTLHSYPYTLSSPSYSLSLSPSLLILFHLPLSIPLSLPPLTCASDGLVVCHLPYGPTASFSLSNTVMRHDLPDVGTMSEAYPHLIFHNFKTNLGLRVSQIISYSIFAMV